MKKMFLVCTTLIIALIGFANIKMNTSSVNNTSLLTLDKVEALGWTEFIIMPDGRVGILADNPYYHLTVGNYHTNCNAYIYGGSWMSSSDIRLKENIRNLDNALSIVQGLRGVSYNYINDTTKRETIGFIANEVREILPGLVSEDNDGYLGLNYDGFIPLLATAIQEQQETIESQQATIARQQVAIEKQQNQIDELKDLLKSVVVKSPTEVSYAGVQQAVLYQNNPNPWKEATEISYELPEGAGDATIYISDLSGKLLKILPATSSGSVTLKVSDLKAGIYLYSLIVDGNIIDMKKMILTK